MPTWAREVLLGDARNFVWPQECLDGPHRLHCEDGFEIYIPSDEQTSARVWYEILEAGKEFGAIPAASVRATRCAWKASCRSMDTKFPTRSMCGKRDWIVSANGEGGFYRTAPRSRKRMLKV